MVSLDFLKKRNCDCGETSGRITAGKLLGRSMLCILPILAVSICRSMFDLIEDERLTNSNKMCHRHNLRHAVPCNTDSRSAQLNIRSKRAAVTELNNLTDNPGWTFSSPTFEPEPTPEPQPTSEPESTSEPEPTSLPASEPSAESQAEPEIRPNSTAEPIAEPGPPAKKIVFLTVLSVLLVVILLTNIGLVVTILRSKPLRKPANMTILSLAAADICIALFVIPGMVSAQFSERYMVNIICKICHYASHVSMSAASLSLVAVAGDRLKAIALPFKPKMTMGEVGIVVVVVWILSCAYGFRVPFLFEITPVLVQDDYGQVVSRMICSVPVADSQRNAPLVVLDFIIVFALPAITIAISYISLLYFLSKNSMQMGGKASGAKKNKKALRLSIFMIAMFIFCHMPVHTFRLYLSRDHAIIPESFDLIRAFDIMSILNGVLNPIVYGFLNKQIRDAFLDLVGRNGQRPSHTAHNRVHPTGLTDVDASKIATIIASDTQ